MESSVMTMAVNPALAFNPSLHYSCYPARNTSVSSVSSNKNFLSKRKQGVQVKKTECRALKTRISCSSNGAASIKEVDETQFSDLVLKSDRPVLVEFVATWCGPCRLVAPSINALAQEYKERITVVKIDHDANPNLIKEYQVYGLPAFILFKDGQPVPDSKREGAITKAKLKEYIDGLLESLSVA